MSSILSHRPSQHPVFELRSGESWRNPFPMYDALREHDPVQHVEDGDFWVLSRWDDVLAAAKDTATFSSAHGLTVHYDDLAMAGLDEIAPLVMLDPPEHTEFRRLVSRGFTPRQVSSLENAVRTFVRERLDLLRADGGDIVSELFKPLPSFVVAHYLGVPPEDRPRFDRWTDLIVAAGAGDGVLSAGDAVAELFDYFSELVERRRTEPGDDVISALVGCSGDEVPVLRILGFAFTMVAGGNDTVTGLLGGAAELLAEHPEQREQLVRAPELLPSAVEELLRMVSPVQGLARTLRSDVELHGSRIPAGRRVLLLYAAANRDPRQFGLDADHLDVLRPPGQILSFSLGAHHCLGAAAARLQGRVALDELLATFPRFAVDVAAGRFATGSYVRRYESLPFLPEAGR